jgi:hypothetical protein
VSGRLGRAALMLLAAGTLAAPARAEERALSPAAVQALQGRSLPSYEIRLQLAAEPPAFEGQLRYRSRVPEGKPAERLYFEILPNTPRFAGKRPPAIEVREVRQGGRPIEHTHEAGVLELRLPEPLAPGAEIEVELAFTGRLPVQRPGKTELMVQSFEQLVGLIAGAEQSDYGLFGVGDGILSLVRFYPAAVPARPAADAAGIGDARTLELADYSVELTAPEGLVLASTGVVLETRPAGEGRSLHRIWAPACRDFAMLLSSRFQVRFAAAGPVLVRSFHDAAHGRRGQLALDAAVRALGVFEEAFGPYPYTELDVVEAPLYGGAGGVEFPGLVTVASLFYRETPPRAAGDLLARVLADIAPLLRETMEFVVVHEVAHQWWNAAVASDAVGQPYLDEALANFSTLLYFERVHGKAAAERHEFLQMRMTYLVLRMSGGADMPANLPASRYANSLQYAALVYGKAALYYQALRRQMGDEAFFGALRDYYRRHFLRLARAGALSAAFRQRASDPAAVDTLFRRWIEGTHGDEDIGRVGLLDLLRAMHELDSEIARGGRVPVDPVELMRLLFEKAAQ